MCSKATTTITSLDTVIIGGGQAGLAMSRCLLESGIPLESQVILERGQIGERWRSSYWDSLHLLTPNWQSRLPGNWSYTGSQPEGFMSKKEFVEFLQDYANSFQAPIQTNTNVERVEEYKEEAHDTARFKVTATTTTTINNATTTNIWLARNVVIATGYCDLPKIPAFANDIPSDNVLQLSALDYKNPAQVLSWFRTKTSQASKPDDSTNNVILIVGAGASGIQISNELAEELHHSHKNTKDMSPSPGISTPRIMISVGKHCRWPRTYRGKDILFWVDRMGAFRATAVQEEEASSPGPQLTGNAIGQQARDASLYQLHNKWGVDIVGKMTFNGECIQFDNANLGACLKQADDGCIKVLQYIDDFIDQQGLNETNTTGLTASPFQDDSSGDTTICPRLHYNHLSSRISQIDLHPSDLEDTRVCIIWATGFTRDYPFLSELLHQKLWDPERCILRNHGGIVTTQPGLYVLGYRWLRRKDSNFVGGVGDDARELAKHMVQLS